MWIGSSSLTEATQKNLLGHLGHRHQVGSSFDRRTPPETYKTMQNVHFPINWSSSILNTSFVHHWGVGQMLLMVRMNKSSDPLQQNFQISLSPMSLELAKHSNTCRNMLDLYGLVILVIFGFQFWESSYLWFLNGLQGQREVRRPRRQKRYLSDPVCIDIIWWLRSFVDLEDATKCRGHDLQCNSDLYSLNSPYPVAIQLPAMLV